MHFARVCDKCTQVIAQHPMLSQCAPSRYSVYTGDVA